MERGIPEQETSAIARLRYISPLASAFGMCVSCLVLTGWAFSFSSLRSVIPGQPQMVPNTAVAFILACLSLWLVWSEKRSRWAQALMWVCTSAVVLIGLFTLVEY